MSKLEIKNSILYILIKGLKIYISNIDKFLLFMLFPVLGQILGIILAFGLALGFAPIISEKINSVSGVLLCVVLLTLPGLLIFAKAFWEFMVSYIALNSMTDGVISTGKVYDFDSHREVATRRTLHYIWFLCVVGVLSSVATSIFFIVPGAVFWIYFILVFQVYTFEPELPVFEVFKRSFMLISGNWLRTAILLITLIFFSIFITTQGVSVIFDYLNLTNIICYQFDKITSLIPLTEVNRILRYLNQPLLTYSIISKQLFMMILTFIIMGLTLPIRSICWSLWYINLSDTKDRKQRKISKKQRKEYIED